MEIPRWYRRWSIGFLVYTLFVIVWGAVVRATLSGDGCGDHWPLCNGEVLPPEPATKTIVELTHRVTSGLVWIGALAQIFIAKKVSPKGHPVRRAAGWLFFWMTIEALLGAGLVIFRMVAENPDSARGYWAGAHLANTFILLAMCLRHVFAAHDIRLVRPDLKRDALPIALSFGFILVGIAGAIAALGDTLFPVDSLAEGFAQDFDTSSHIFLRLRTFHPILAIGVTVGSLWYAAQHLGETLRPYSAALIGLLIAQVAIGFLNLLLLAPIWLQLTHLVVGDLTWLAFLSLGHQLRASRGTETGAEEAVPVPAAL